MRRLFWLLCLPLVALPLGCSNRPLAGMMDCFFPSRGGNRAPRDLPRPTDRDPIPPPVFDPAPAGDGFRRGDLPPPLGSPISPDGGPIRREEAPWVPREPSPGVMPLPSGGRN